MKPDLADQLRSIIRKSGESENALAKRAGVSQASLNRFMRGGEAQLRQASKLAKALGLRLARERE